MGFFNMCEYAAVNSRVHCSKARLLGVDVWQSLQASRSLFDAMHTLANTSLGKNLSAGKGKGEELTKLPSLRSVEHSLHQNFVASECSHLRFLHGAPAECLKQLLQLYDLLNLKKILRAELSGVPRDTLELYDLGRASILPRKVWQALDRGEKIGRSFEGTIYGEAYRTGRAAFAGGHNLLQLELHLEKVYLDALFEAFKKLGAGAEEGSLLYRHVVDETCLEYSARLLYHHGLEPPATLLLLPLRYALYWNEEIFWRVSKAKSEVEFFALLSKEKFWKDLDTSSLGACALSLRSYCVREAKKILRNGSPLSFSPTVACFLLKRQEIRDVRSLLQAKRFRREGVKLLMPEAYHTARGGA